MKFAVEFALRANGLRPNNRHRQKVGNNERYKFILNLGKRGSISNHTKTQTEVIDLCYGFYFIPLISHLIVVIALRSHAMLLSK